MIPNSYYPDGGRRSEVFVLRDDYDGNLNNTPETRIQVTNDPTLQPGVGSTDWVVGDAMVSFIGRRWSSTDPGASFTEGGVYVVPLAFSGDGSISGAIAAPTSPIVASGLNASMWPTISGRDPAWSPDGTLLVWEAPSGLRITDVATGSTTQIFSEFARNPRWSPDGSKIAFTGSAQSIATINANGTGVKTVISSTADMVFYHPVWSPDSGSIACTAQSREIGPSGWFNMDVCTVRTNGKGQTLLTNTPDPFHERPQGWR